MKIRLMFLMMCLFAFGGLTANAQLRPVAMTGDSSSGAYSSAITTTAASVVKEVLEDGYVTITGTATKFTGTVAGKMELQGSMDGTNYERIRGCALTGTADTLILANVTTVQKYSWKVDPTYFRYYRVTVTPTSGHVRVRGLLWRKKKTGN